MPRSGCCCACAAAASSDNDAAQPAARTQEIPPTIDLLLLLVLRTDARASHRARALPSTPTARHSSLRCAMATNPSAERTVVRAACPHDCPDTCAMLVTTELRAGKRVATEIAGDPNHPTTAGKLCTKVARYLERVYHPDRLMHPLKRVGPKGQGRFER